MPPFPLGLFVFLLVCLKLKFLHQLIGSLTNLLFKCKTHIAFRIQILAYLTSNFLGVTLSPLLAK